MELKNKTGPHIEKKNSLVWTGLQDTTERLYSRILRSPVGRFFTSYRSFDKGIFGGGRRTDKIRSASPARMTLLRAAESSRLFGALRQLGALLLSVPINFYGLFCFVSAALALIGYYVIPLTSFKMTFGISSPWMLIAILLFSLPLCLSGKPTYRSLGNSVIMRTLLVRFLGVPEESVKRARSYRGTGWMYFAFFLTPLAAFISLRFQPWIIPLALLLLGVIALILSVPESGVILSCALLPLMWVSDIVLYVVVAVIITVWISYVLKLIRMHRTMRFDILDVAVLIFGAMILVGGFSGSVVSYRTVHEAVILTALLSVYFLIVNLMAGRAYLKRCLVGVLLSVILATVLGFAGYISPDGMEWIAGSYAGDKISDAWSRLVGFLVGINSDVILLVTFTLPLALSAFMRCKRVIGKVGMTVLLLADVALIAMSWSRGAWICLAAGVIIFFLLYSHTALSVAVVSLPVVGCGVLWFSTVADKLSVDAPLVISRILNLGDYGTQISSSRQTVWSGAWKMIINNPFGIGVGSDALAAVYPRYATGDILSVATLGNTYLDILASLGFVGLAVFVVCAFLLIQKAFSALRHTASGKERWVLLGGVVSVVVLLMMGAVRSITENLGVYFAAWIIVGVVSAYANITFEETDVLRSVSEKDEAGRDVVLNVAD
ncbi:MAG: O-antigen ligase family protein [Clostridia bacterium]|nr:O-antigen ligase family protein [Clostridia bacterium]